MLEAKLPYASLLKKIVESLKDLVTDAQFEFSENGLQLQAMDSSHVSLCHLKLNVDAFGEFRCDKATTMGLSLMNLAKVLKCASNEDTLTMKHRDEDDTVSLLFENPGQDKIMDFNMKLIEIDQEQLNIPDTEYKCTIKIPALEFKTIISDLLALGDTCTISCSKEGVRFSVDGDVGKANIMLKPGQVANENKKVQIEMDEPVELRFALRYLNLFSKATALSGMVSLSMSTDIPLLVKYDIEETGLLEFFLAPKIDDEE